MRGKGGKDMGGERRWEKPTTPLAAESYHMLSQPLGELVFAHKESLHGYSNT